MDKIYTGFGPLTTLTNPKEASMTLNMFKDIARSKQAQSINQIATEQQNEITAEEARKRVDNKEIYMINIAGLHYRLLDPERKKKVLNHFINEISTGRSAEKNIEYAFRNSNIILPLSMAEKKAMALAILKGELVNIQSTPKQPAEQPRDQQQPKAQEAPSAGSANADSSRQSPVAVDNNAGSKVDTKQTQQTAAGGESKNKTPSQGSGFGAGLLSLVGQGLVAVIDAIKKLPSAPKVSDQVLAQMIVADQPQYWFPNNAVSETGFYGPFIRGQNIFWAEIEYNGEAEQFMYSGRYASVPVVASQAVKESARGT
jgi:hypothetical protein